MTHVSRRQLFLGAAALTGAQLTPAPAVATPDAHLYGVRAIFSGWRRHEGLVEFICLDVEGEDRRWTQFRTGVCRYARVPFNGGHRDLNHIDLWDRVTFLGYQPANLYSREYWRVHVIVNSRGRRLEFPTWLRERNRGERI